MSSVVGKHAATSSKSQIFLMKVGSKQQHHTQKFISLGCGIISTPLDESKKPHTIV
jgi:hypothetical protein